MGNDRTSLATEAEQPKPSAPMILIAGLLTLAIIVWFYGFVPRFGFDESLSVFGWLWGAWSQETQLEHGKLAPFLILGLIGWRFRDLRAAASGDRCSKRALIAVFAGAVLFWISHRFVQPRVSALGLPVLLWGCCHFLWGWRVAKIVFVPLFLFWLVIPWVPLYQAQTQLLLWVVSLAHHGCSLFRVETKMVGLVLIPLEGEIQPIHVGMGRSNGLPDLMALLMISAAWAYVARIRMWQKVVLFLSAIPIAILGNALRLVSILVIADRGDARWAATTWYDWSDLALVYPCALMLFLALHSLFLGRPPWKKKSVFVAA